MMKRFVAWIESGFCWFWEGFLVSAADLRLYLSSFLELPLSSDPCAVDDEPPREQNQQQKNLQSHTNITERDISAVCVLFIFIMYI